MAKIVNLVKEVIGKDLTKLTLPVFLNEPTTILMKPAEFQFFYSHFSEAA